MLGYPYKSEHSVFFERRGRTDSIAVSNDTRSQMQWRVNERS